MSVRQAVRRLLRWQRYRDSTGTRPMPRGLIRAYDRWRKANKLGPSDIGALRRDAAWKES